MTIASTFEYFKPGTLDLAVELLERYGPKGFLLAGGTDLVGWLRDDAVAPEAVIDLKGVAGLDVVALRDGVLEIGALATFNQVLESAIVAESWPLFGEMARVVASYGIRNRATVVGNICAAVACCDSGPVLLVHEAGVHLHGPGGDRTVPITEWFRGNRRTAKDPGEIVTGVSVPMPAGAHAGCFVKLPRYHGEDLAQASVTVLALEGHRYRVAFGAVAATPVRAYRIEALLAGKPLDDALLAEAAALLPQETSPITDVRSTRQYRVHMLGVMLERGLRAAVARLEGGGPAYGTELL